MEFKAIFVLQDLIVQLEVPPRLDVLLAATILTQVKVQQQDAWHALLVKLATKEDSLPFKEDAQQAFIALTL